MSDDDEKPFNGRDTLTAAGAARLAKAIETFWQREGAKTVKCIVAKPETKGGRVYVVRSNLVGALPPLNR